MPAAQSQPESPRNVAQCVDLYFFCQRRFCARNQTVIVMDSRATSALTLLSDFETSFDRDFRQSPLNILASDQRHAPRPEPLLGDAHQPLKRTIAGLAEELDRSSRLSESYAASEVVYDAPSTRARTARREGANLLVPALDDQPPGLAGEPSDRPLISVSSAGCQELLPRPRVCGDAEGPPCLDRRPQSAFGSHFSNESILYNLCFSRPGIGIAPIA
jgi:hypothetical protein